MLRITRAAVVVAAALAMGGVSAPMPASAAPLPPGGIAWTESYLAPGTQLLPYAGVVQFRDRSMWVAGSDLPEEPYAKFTPKMVAGGANGPWTNVPLAPMPAGANVQAESIDALSPTSAVLTGDSSPLLGGFLAERLEGGNWHLDTVPAPADTLGGALLSVKELAPNDIWAVGYAEIDLKTKDENGYDLTRNDPVIRHWDGTAWQVVSLPESLRGTGLFSLTESHGRMWAVGRDFVPGDSIAPVMLEFDGRSWNRVALPPLPADVAALNSVSARSPRDVWAVGGYRVGRTTHGLVLHFDGLSWSSVPLPAASDDVLDSVAATDNGMVAFGNRDSDDTAFGVRFAGGKSSPVYLPDGQKGGHLAARRVDVTDGRVALTATRQTGEHWEGVVLTGWI